MRNGDCGINSSSRALQSLISHENILECSMKGFIFGVRFYILVFLFLTRNLEPETRNYFLS